MSIFPKSVYILSAAIIILLWFVQPAHALTLKIEDKLFILPESAQITGSFTLPQQNLLTSDRLTLEDIFNPKDASIPQYKEVYSYNPKAVYTWIKSVSPEINQTVTEPVLELSDNKVIEFNPGKNGVIVDEAATTIAVLNGLKHKQTQVTGVFSLTTPVKKLADTNNLGINELVTSGSSTFSGSSKNRRQNISTGAQKIKGSLIAPGEEFSFNKALGDITAEAGYAPEIVIKRTGLEPELGGGICQVSSTVFRSAFNGGLPITQRKNHSFAVSHYAPQGTDATIYPGLVDLKFKNDTPAHILIWPEFPNKDTLVFNFYGTRDNRQVTVKPAVQFDKKSDGSLKATWERTVTKNGASKTDIIRSTYLPPALFKKVETSTISAPTINTNTPTSSPATSL